MTGRGSGLLFTAYGGIGNQGQVPVFAGATNADASTIRRPSRIRRVGCYAPITRWSEWRRLRVCGRTSPGQRPRSTASAHAALFMTSGLSIS